MGGALLCLSLTSLPGFAGHPSSAAFGISLSETPQRGPAPLLVQFSAQLFPNSTSATFTWVFGDGGSFQETRTGFSTPAHEYISPGTYLAKVTADSAAGAVNASVVVTVGQANLTVSILETPASGTAPLTVQFGAHASGGSGTLTALLWSFGDGGDGSGSNVTYTFLHPGRFVVSLNATDEDGAQSHANSVVDVLASDPSQSSHSQTSAGGESGWTVPFAVAGGVGASLVGLGALLRHRQRRIRGFEARTVGMPPPGAVVVPEAVDLGTSELRTETSTPELLSHADLPPVVPPVGSPAALASPPRREPDPTEGTGDEDPLRLSERVLVHLFWFGTDEATGVGRIEATQLGLARAMGVRQHTVSKVLSRLVDGGALETTTRHVSGASRRVKVYSLTPRGRNLAVGLGALRSPRVAGPSRLPTLPVADPQPGPR
ncbi:MAG: PKD domain-containing protein [Thermoplasmata archaeon]|nr:PKD domain-containing protein [Thermoplasmata archaeon]